MSNIWHHGPNLKVQTFHGIVDLLRWSLLRRLCLFSLILSFLIILFLRHFRRILSFFALLFDLFIRLFFHLQEGAILWWFIGGATVRDKLNFLDIHTLNIEDDLRDCVRLARLLLVEIADLHLMLNYTLDRRLLKVNIQSHMHMLCLHLVNVCE